MKWHYLPSTIEVSIEHEEAQAQKDKLCSDGYGRDRRSGTLDMYVVIDIVETIVKSRDPKRIFLPWTRGENLHGNCWSLNNPGN